MSIYASNEELVYMNLRTEIENNARAVTGTPEARLGDLIPEIRAQWLEVTLESWHPHFDRELESQPSLRLQRVLSSGLLLPNGYVASLGIEPAGQGHFDVQTNIQSVRQTFGIALEDDPVMSDCLSVNFPNYPSMGVYKALLGFMYSKRSNQRIDFYDWHKEKTGEYPSGGSACDTPYRGRYSWQEHRFIGATGMMFVPETMVGLRRYPELSTHFDSEDLVSFRGSGCADDIMSRSIASEQVPSFEHVLKRSLELVARGISLN